MTDNLIALVDCDILQYRCGFAADAQLKKDYLEHDPGASDEDIKEALAETEYTAFALQNVDTVLESIQERFPAGMECYIQEGRHFRYDIATIKPYKGNRDETHKPKYYKEIKKHLVDRWRAHLVTDIETDDELGIVQLEAEPGTTCIVSTDKDMDTIKGWHFNWVKGELYWLTTKDADRCFFHQMMTGDPTDNIAGLKGVGPKTADKVIEEHGNSLDGLRNTIQSMYQKEFGDEWQLAYEEFGKLLYILRKRDEMGEVPYILYG